jgi:hypothetical protein
VTTSGSLEVTHADRGDRSVAQLFGSIALRQQRNTETGFDQALLRGQAVDRGPVDFTEAKRLKQRKYMRRRDLAPSRHHGKSDPALAAEIGEFRHTAAGARMVRRAHHLQPFGKQQFAIEIARAVAVIAQADGCLAAPYHVADLRAGRGAQPTTSMSAAA